MVTLFSRQKHSTGFTIVELLVIIVVIGILAGITIIGYGAWRDRVQTTTLESDLLAARTAMRDRANFGEGFPGAIPSTSFSTSEGIEARYVIGNSKWYCIEAYPTTKPTAIRHITSENEEPVTGSCPTSVPTAFGPATSGSAVVSTVAGSGSNVNADGTGAAASFATPTSIALYNDTIYVRSGSAAIQMISPSGAVSSIPTNYNRWAPNLLELDSAGTLYMTTTSDSQRVRTITPDGIVSSYTGGGSDNDDNEFREGTYTQARYHAIRGLAINRSNNAMYISDGGATARRLRLAANGNVTTVAGNGTSAHVDGTGASASFLAIGAITVGPDGAIYVIDSNMIRKVTPGGVVTTIAGSSSSGYADGTGTAARFNTPRDLYVAANNDIYVADTNNHRIRKVTQAGVVTTIAGNGTAAFAEGVGTNSSFNTPTSIEGDASGLYVADSLNHRIRKVNY